jgi:hypothetical protein
VVFGFFDDLRKSRALHRLSFQLCRSRIRQLKVLPEYGNRQITSIVPKRPHRKFLADRSREQSSQFERLTTSQRVKIGGQQAATSNGAAQTHGKTLVAEEANVAARVAKRKS